MREKKFKVKNVLVLVILENVGDSCSEIVEVIYVMLFFLVDKFNFIFC